jgi:hypothetical protein
MTSRPSHVTRAPAAHRFQRDHIRPQTNAKSLPGLNVEETAAVPAKMIVEKNTTIAVHNPRKVIRRSEKRPE